MIFFSASGLQGKEAKIYYSLLNKAEDYIIKEKLDSALIFYEKAFEKFDYPFYKHLKQAAIVAFYAKDCKILNKYLVKAIKRGMNKSEFDFFIKATWCNDNMVKIKEDFPTYRRYYISSLDTNLMMNYIEMDVIDQLMLHPLVNKNSNQYRSLNKKMKVRYLKLLDSMGFPTEKKVGLAKIFYASKNKFKTLKFDNDTVWKHKLVYHTDLYNQNKNEELYCVVIEEKGKSRPEALRPGNSFFWHLAMDSSLDSALINKLEQGFNDLKIYPQTIAKYHRSITNDLNYDFNLTHYSQYFQNYKIVHRKYSYLSQEDKVRINKIRAKYYVRTVEKEEELLRVFYRLKYKQELRKITKNTLNKVGYEYYTFMHI